jgi:hypothetical protein
MSTKSGIRCPGGWTDDLIVREVELPNGRKIKRLTTEAGANEFVEAVGIDFISTNLTATNDHEMFVMYIIMRIVIRSASPEKVAACFPESELRLFVEHMRDELDKLSKESNWLRSGVLLLRYDLLMCIVAYFTMNIPFIKIFYSNGMEAVAKFYASRKQKNETPNYRVAHWIINLVDNTLRALTQEGLKHEKVFGAMEKAGLLGQFIRCVSVDAEYSAHALECLQMCLQLVKKKLKPGTPTGDILDAVLVGKDGPINEKTKSSLARLQSLAQISNYGSECVTKETKECRHCKRPETHGILMKCQRCRASYYCSRECQVADWKRHKTMCKVISGGTVSRSTFKTSTSTVDSFIESNLFHIAKELYKKTQEFNVSKRELLLEINFFEDAPALRNEFNVWLTSDFWEGSSVADAPDWFRTYVDKKTVARLWKQQYEEWTCADLFVVWRASNGMVTVSRLRMPLTEAGYSLLSDEIVEAIAREDYDRMLACMGQALTEDYYREKKA